MVSWRQTLIVLLIIGLTALGIYVLVTMEPGDLPMFVMETPETNNEPIDLLAMPARLVALEITVGLADKEPTKWDGTVQVAQGQLHDLAVLQGGPAAAVSRESYRAETTPNPYGGGLLHPTLRLTLMDPKPDATVTVQAQPGPFTIPVFPAKEIAGQRLFNGQVTVRYGEGAVRLTQRETEDDYPALARGKDEGEAWLAMLTFKPFRPPAAESVLSGNFDQLTPKGHVDQIRLARFDGRAWQTPLQVNKTNGEKGPPAIAVDGKGRVLVAWSENENGDWDIHYRWYTPPAKGETRGLWSAEVRIGTENAVDGSPVAVADSKGVVWLAWQCWRNENFEIMLTAIAEHHPWEDPRIVSVSRANDWAPTLAADKQGNVYLAWDTYDQDNYDIRMAIIPPIGELRVVEVTKTPRLEVRPSLACDDQNRVWLAFEEGAEQWGKSRAGSGVVKRALAGYPGVETPNHRQVKLFCWDGQQWQQPAAPLPPPIKETTVRCLPRIMTDSRGGVWLTYRQLGTEAALGEVWYTFATRYDGQGWSQPKVVPFSNGLRDSRVALTPQPGGEVLAVYPADGRTQPYDRDQNDLYAYRLTPPGGATATAAGPKLVPAETVALPTLPPVHMDQAGDIARLRSQLVESSIRKYRIRRGEFQPHTEISSHAESADMVEDAFRYALDAAKLDWFSLAELDWGYHNSYLWWLQQKATEYYHRAPAFITLHAYEIAPPRPEGPPIFAFPEANARPLPRKTATSRPWTETIIGNYLGHFNGIRLGTPITEWKAGDAAERSAPEKPAPAAATSPEAPGTAPPAAPAEMPKGMTVLFIEDLTREGVLDAFRTRHAYVATDNMLVNMQVGYFLMGEKIRYVAQPKVVVAVTGTAPIAKVSLYRDDHLCHSASPNTKQATVEFADREIKEGETARYWARIEQTDGQVAWTAPLWVIYSP